MYKAHRKLADAESVLQQVHASSVISLLQSDMKVALKSAFGNLDGPLTVTDWCKGRSQLGDAAIVSDGYAVESTVGEVKDSSSSVTLAGGEPISPSQSSGGSSCFKGTPFTSIFMWIDL